MAQQLGFADAFLAGKAGQKRRLACIAELIDWCALEVLLPGAMARSGPGRPAYRPLAMFEALLLAQWYQLSDPGLEEAMADRISFRHFCGFAIDEATPGETTFCRFRLSIVENHHSKHSAGPVGQIEQLFRGLPREKAGYIGSSAGGKSERKSLLGVDRIFLKRIDDGLLFAEANFTYVRAQPFVVKCSCGENRVL